ncbi:MAG: efflux RND transporter periplasmic adaptor subunit [Chloroherpetonaceae bacterium]|nr:efflux RND transporter periplasmic adaptor subunit [Chloroherpetonaceae bacterium]
MDIIKAQIDKTEVRAPFNGVVGLRYVSVGSYISPTTRIASIQNICPLKLDFSIPEKYATLVRKGDKVLFRVQGIDKVLEGQVYAIEPKIDPATRTLPIRAIYPNSDRRILPGAFAEVELLLQNADSAVMIPSEALVPELKGQKVFVAKQGKAVAKSVEIGLRTDREIQVTSGLSDGDTVITTGILQLRPGMAVQFVEFQSLENSD